MRKYIALLLCLALLLCAGCGAAAEKAEAPVAEPVEVPAEAVEEPAKTAGEFTDSTGRVIELPDTIEKVAVTGSLAQLATLAVAPEMLAGIANEWNAEGFIPAEYYELPVLGQLYGGKGELNLETLLASGAQLVIDIGEDKGSVGEDMDELTEQTGLPFVHISCSTATMGEMFRMLGELLGKTEEAEALASYCESVYADACALSERVEKVSMLYLLGDEGLNVIAAGSYHSELFDLLATNSAVVDEPSSKGSGNETDMEQLLLWDPEVILFAPDSIYDSVGDDPTWQSLSAIQSGRYYKAPSDLYNWLGFPPGIQRCLGMLWLGALLYPDAVDYDLYTRAAEFYELFYHTELTEAQFAALTANSID